MMMARNFELMLGQTLNYSVWNDVIFAMSSICKLIDFLLNNVRKVAGLVLSRTSC
jgi:hypothetical protein